MKFAHSYKLLRDIPGYKAGRTITWSGSSERFYFRKISEWKHDKGAEGIHVDWDGPSFTVEQAQDATWFQPISELVDFIPAFPGPGGLEEFIYLRPECRLVEDVDVCRAITRLLDDPGFQKRLYQFYKQQYEAFHGLNVPERDAETVTAG